MKAQRVVRRYRLWATNGRPDIIADNDCRKNKKGEKKQINNMNGTDPEPF